MDKLLKNYMKYLLMFLAVFIPFRELIALYSTNYIKFLPDLLIWCLLILILIKNKFKLNLKIYDFAFLGFLVIGLISSIINSVSLLGYALQVRSIGTMYVLFYILRNEMLEKTFYIKITNYLMIVNIILIVFSFIEFLSNKTLFFPKVWANNIIYASNFERTYSFMNNPNTFAIFTFMIMYLVYFLNRNKFTKRHFLYYLLAFLGIILSASRSTILIILLFLIFLTIKSILKKSFYNLIWLITLFISSFLISYGFVTIKNSIIINTFYSNISNNSNSSTSATNNNTNEFNGSNESNGNKSDSNLSNNEILNNNVAIIDRFKETTSGVTTENSNKNGRIFIIKTGFKILKNYPILGTGFGTYGSAASRMVTPSIYEKYNLPEGFYSDNEYIKVIVETGVCGTIMFAIFILSILYKFIKSKEEYKIFLFIAFLFIGMFYNVYEMQVLCFVLYISFMFLNNDYMKSEIKENKVSILSLHLGYGGVEQVVVNTANMLSSEYEVEIISLYKNKGEIPFSINKNVKITYLSNLISNREEFKEAFRNKKLVAILKEGLKALYILINKNHFVRRAISESDAKIIISSRYSFSKILNYSGRNNTYKIHHEHTYSISDKYINNLNKLKNIDYIIPVSMCLYEKYKDRLNIKLIHIPNALNYFPSNNEISKLDNKNLIAIGRCVQEKGFMDLLEVVKLINNEEVTLHLFGDGYQLKLLKEKALKLKINNQVKFWGFKDQDFIKKHMMNSSLYVMTSFEESFGLVIIEAMSYGIPCVAFDTAEGAKYIINEKNGYFIKNRNNLEMANVIKQFFELDNQMKYYMSENARKTSENYKYDKIRKQWLTFIKNVLEDNYK